MKYFVYIVRARDGSLYTGYTWNLAQRIKEHNFSNRGAKSLRGKLPVKLTYYEEFKSKAEALGKEAEIKGWRKEKKEKLISALVLSKRNSSADPAVGGRSGRSSAVRSPATAGRSQF